MTNLYFTYDSVVSREEAHYIAILIKAASASECEIILAWDPKAVDTAEGYINHRYVVSAPSQIAFERFLKQVESQTGFTNWLSTSKEYYEAVSQWQGRRVGSLQEQAGTLSFGKQLEGLYRQGEVNEHLRKQLETRHSLYYGFNYRIPNVLPSDWIDKIVEATSGLELGSTVRIVEPKQTTEGFYEQAFVIRVFSQKELEKFAEKVGLSRKAFYDVSKEIFQSGITLYPIAKESIWSTLEKMSRANRELQEKIE